MPLRGGGKKAGVIVVRRVGVDTIDDVVGATLVRIANNKSPYRVILENASQVAELRQAAAGFAQKHGELIKAAETGDVPRGMKARRYDAGPAAIANLLEPAIRQLDGLLVDNETTGTIARLDPHASKVYVVAHGKVGGRGIFRKTEDGSAVRTSSNALATFFRDTLRLSLEHEDLRLLVCRGATQPPKGDGIPTAQHVANAMGKAGFHAMAVSGYGGSIRSFPQIFEGRLHNTIVPDLKTKPVRRGAIRQAFRAPSEAGAAAPVPEPLPSPPDRPAAERVLPDPAPAIAEIARQMREMGSWNNTGGELAPRLLTELPAWPEGRALELLGRRQTDAGADLVELAVFGRERPGVARVSVLLDGAHYTAIEGDRLVQVPADGDCFFHAVLQALKADLHVLAGSLGLPVDASAETCISALRNRLGDYVEANPGRVESMLQDLHLGSDSDPAHAETQLLSLPQHLSRESRTLERLRQIAQSLVPPTSQPDAHAIARALLAPELVAGLVEMHDGLQVRGYQASGDPSRRAALKRQNALRKSIDVGYLHLLNALVQSGALPAGDVWEALRATQHGGQVAPYVLSSASEASLDVRHAHALAALLLQLAERMAGGSLELRTTLLAASSSSGLRSGDKYRDFYGRLFGDGSKQAQTPASIVAAKRLADADLIPTRSEIEGAISPARATKYLKAAQRAAKEYRRLADDVRVEPSHASLEQIARKLVRQLDPAKLQRDLAVEAEAFGNHERKERRMVANGRVEAMIRDMVQEQWSRAMAEASRDLQPGLFAWMLAPDTALSYAEAARSLPHQAPEQLVRMIFEEVVAKPEMQAYVEQLVEGGNVVEGEALAAVLPDLGHAVESEGRPLVDRVRARAQAAADVAAREQADRAAADAARDAAEDAAWRSRREADAQARREADRAAADAARDAADAARGRAESLARERAHADAEAQAARAVTEETRRAFDRQMQRLERVHAGNVANMRDADIAMQLDAAPDVPRTRVGMRLRAAEYLDERGQPRVRWR